MAYLEKKRLLHVMKKLILIVICLVLSGVGFSNEVSIDELNMMNEQANKVEEYSKNIEKEFKNFQPPCLKNLSKDDLDVMNKAKEQAINISQEALKKQQQNMGFNNNDLQVLIFLSFSMPEVAIKQWLLQAEKINAPVMIKGLVDRSLKTTMAKMKKFADDGSKAGVYVDPVRFKQYGINKVPAVVVSEKIDVGCVGDECKVPPYLLVHGNGSLHSALEAMKGDNELGDIASKYLSKIRGKL